MIRYTRAEVAEIVESFIEGTSGRWDWDDFLSIPIDDPYLDAIRLRCNSTYDEAYHGYWCGPEGLNELRRILQELRAGP